MAVTWDDLRCSGQGDQEDWDVPSLGFVTKHDIWPSQAMQIHRWLQLMMVQYSRHY